MKYLISRIILGAFIISQILGCEQEEFDEETCTFNLLCWGRRNIIGEHINFIRSDYYCHIPTSTYKFRGNNVAGPLHITIQNLLPSNDGSISFQHQYTDWSDLITVINIKSKITETRILPQLDNLALLNYSDCNIIKATLSNTNELKSLVTLDYSNNNISYLYYDDNEYMYTNLQTLDLSYNSLEAIPDAIFHPFTKLSNLDLSYNNLQSVNMLTFEGIKELRYLNMSNNQLFDINGSLFRFNQLLVVNLSNNKLTRIHSRDLDKLNKLETLDLHSNAVVYLESNTFYNIVSLKYLDLSQNRINGIEKDMLRNCTLLQHVDLSNNNINQLETDLFKTKDIVYFNIEHNHLQGPLVQGMFEGLGFVTELDLSHQSLTSVEDFAFMGAGNVNSLFLNNNNISFLAKHCFSGLYNLKTLDLSSNNLSNIDFDSNNLQNLISLQVRRNKITKLNKFSFQGMNRLQFIDLSGNSITTIESHTFEDLRNLVRLEISSNPLQGELTGKTFEGLSSLPTLDISNTQFTLVQNSSFLGMTHLTSLNLSHSNIENINFNAFLETRSVEILDLSRNRLSSFLVNATDLLHLKIVILSFNYIEIVNSVMFQDLRHLNKVLLNNNMINFVEKSTFDNLKELNFLDLSFNKFHRFNVSIIENLNSLTYLYLTNMTSNLSFESSNDLTNHQAHKQPTITNLQVTDSDLKHVMFLKTLNLLENVVLRNDKINNISAMDFFGIKNLRYLDLSFNNINFIEPGSFRDNNKLNFLNISHNDLYKIGYGVFPGLTSLETLDISFNNINSLHSEGFYDLKLLRTLIVDHNRITSFYPEDFNNYNLETISIGENPIPCEVLINLQKQVLSFKITAINLIHIGHENHLGVTCNVDRHIPLTTVKYNTSVVSEKILLDIRNILFNMSLTKPENIETKEESLLSKVDQRIKEIHNDFINISSLIETSNNFSVFTKNISESVSKIANETNIYLPKLVKMLATSNSIKSAPPIILAKSNSSMETVLAYVEKIKSELEDKYAIDKDGLEDKIKLLERKVDGYAISSVTSKEKLISAEKSNDTSLVFTETCVALILLMVLCFAVVKLYKSKMFNNRWRSSVSTRQLSESMENSNL